MTKKAQAKLSALLYALVPVAAVIATDLGRGRRHLAQVPGRRRRVRRRLRCQHLHRRQDRRRRIRSELTVYPNVLPVPGAGLCPWGDPDCDCWATPAPPPLPKVRPRRRHPRCPDCGAPRRPYIPVCPDPVAPWTAPPSSPWDPRPHWPYNPTWC